MRGHLKGEAGVSMTTFRITKKIREAANSDKYRLTKEELIEINEHNKLVKLKKQEIKKKRATVYQYTYELLSEKMGVEITRDIIQQCYSYKSFGNMIIHIKAQKGQALTMQLH